MAQLKSWREVAIPHPDVLEGTFLQSEFAADLNAVCMEKPHLSIKRQHHSFNEPILLKECETF
jgi:hypothetical protein